MFIKVLRIYIVLSIASCVTIFGISANTSNAPCAFTLSHIGHLPGLEFEKKVIKNVAIPLLEADASRSVDSDEAILDSLIPISPSLHILPERWRQKIFKYTINRDGSGFRKISPAAALELISELAVMGGELRIALGRQDNSFELEGDKPVIYLTSWAGEQTLIHERTHFRSWRELASHFRLVGDNDTTSRQRAWRTVNSPEGQRIDESRAVLAAISYQLKTGELVSLQNVVRSTTYPRIRELDRLRQLIELMRSNKKYANQLTQAEERNRVLSTELVEFGRHWKHEIISRAQNEMSKAKMERRTDDYLDYSVEAALFSQMSLAELLFNMSEDEISDPLSKDLYAHLNSLDRQIP